MTVRLVLAPTISSRAAMQRKIASYIPLSVIEHPRCPRCRGPRMMLARDSPRPAGYVLRIFECHVCNHIHQTVAATDPLKSDALRWLSSDLKPPD